MNDVAGNKLTDAEVERARGDFPRAPRSDPHARCARSSSARTTSSITCC